MSCLTRRTLMMAFAIILAAVPSAPAATRIDIDETRWISVGAGARGSFASNGERTGDGKSSDANEFRLENFRFYVSGQIHEYLKFEFNTDCIDCQDDVTITILDAVGKLELNQYFNFWAGRLQVPADRAELDGPYYHNTFEYNKTPLYPADFGNRFAGGRIGRDDGVSVWGALFEDKRLTYVAGVYRGVEHSKPNHPNSGDNRLWAGRVGYNVWNVEQNSGYYAKSTYYGTQGDILTLAIAGHYQNNGAGTATHQSDFRGYNADLLMEKTLPNRGVVTLEGEYKIFETGLDEALRETVSDNDDTPAECFCLFDGNAWTVTGLYLFPEPFGIGQVQPYLRFTENRPRYSTYRNEFEIGVNYIIDGHNAKVSLFYQYGDIATKGRAWRGHESGDEVSTVKLGIQWQI